MLEVSVGTGTNAPLIWEAYPDIQLLAGLDISRSMLERCAAKATRAKAPVALVEGDAQHLPFGDGMFDAVFHHGGIAEFSDRRAAIAEMARVAKQGSRIVICDVGVPADGQVSFINRLLLKTQPEYNRPPPTDELPTDARDVSVSWFGRGSWYLVELRNAGRADLRRPKP